MWEWFGVLLSILSEPEQQAGEEVLKSERPLPGFVLMRLNDEEWWIVFRASLSAKLAEKFRQAARLGVSSSSRQLGIVLDWQMILPQVLDWAREYAGMLVTQVSDNIRADIRRIVVEGLQAGEPWRNIRERIQEIGLPRWRAERIARTEVIRAHAQGAKAGYEASGTVRGLRWLDGQVGACPVCQELHEQVRKLDEPFYEDKFGDGLPPRHPNCRCAIAPVTLEQVKRMPEDHPLRDNRRESVAELTDRETWTRVSGVRVTGERKWHWRYRQPKITSANEQEILPEIIATPTHVQPGRGSENITVHYLNDWFGRWWKVPIAVDESGERFVMTFTRDKISKKKQREWGIG